MQKLERMAGVRRLTRPLLMGRLRYRGDTVALPPYSLGVRRSGWRRARWRSLALMLLVFAPSVLRRSIKARLRGRHRTPCVANSALSCSLIHFNA